MMKSKNNRDKKNSPWRNVIATIFTVAMISGSILLITGRKRDFSDSFIIPPNYFSPSKIKNYEPTEDFGKMIKSVPKTPTRLKPLPVSLTNKLGGSGVEITSGDIIGQNSGGRAIHPDGSTVYDEDQRAWFDARFPLLNSEKLKLYGAGTLGWDTENIQEATDALSKENLSYGAGFGFSFRLSNNAELLFDYRLSRPMDSDSFYDTNSAAGFSIKLSF